MPIRSNKARNEIVKNLARDRKKEAKEPNQSSIPFLAFFENHPYLENALTIVLLILLIIVLQERGFIALFVSKWNAHGKPIWDATVGPYVTRFVVPVWEAISPYVHQVFGFLLPLFGVSAPQQTSTLVRRENEM